MAEEHVQALLADVDRDGNGRIDYDEFVKMMLPEMGPSEAQRRRSLQQPDNDGETPRRNVMTARSGAWAASANAHRVLPQQSGDDDE